MRFNLFKKAMRFNLFKNTANEPLRVQAVRIVAIETALDHGLDTEQAARVGHYAVVVLSREDSTTTALEAILAANQFARRLSTLECQIEERHSNIGLVPVHHLQRINDRDRPAPEPVEV